MENGIYAALNRQSGLAQEMEVIANNIANIATTGFRREGVIFAEHVAALGRAEPSLSMASAEGRLIDPTQGVLQQTGGRFDLAIEGPGFFEIATPEGTLLTRAGSFALSPNSELVTMDGMQLLDAGGAPLFVPPDARAVSVAADGTLSADGQPIGQVGIVEPLDPGALQLRGGTRFLAEAGVAPIERPVVMQGFLEASNVEPVIEIARMIEVQRAYEMGQALLDREDERIRAVISTVTR